METQEEQIDTTNKQGAQSKQTANQSKANNKRPELFYLLLSKSLQQTDVGTFIEQMLLENAISFRYSEKLFTNSILWLQAKPITGEAINMVNGNQDGSQQVDTSKFQYDNEFALIYHNSYSFQQDFLSGALHDDLQKLKQLATNRKQQGGDFKVIMLFNSVSDSLFNNDEPVYGEIDNDKKQKQTNITRLEFDKFLIDLTLQFEFDYLEVYTPVEVIDFLKEMHMSIQDKPHRKELSMYSRKGFRPGKKAQMSGFKDTLSLNYISFLMCIPGLSENKAIAIARVWPTLGCLLNHFKSKDMTEKQKKQKVMEVEVQHNLGDKSKKLGKAIAERLYYYFMSVDPSIVIN